MHHRYSRILCALAVGSALGSLTGGTVVHAQVIAPGTAVNGVSQKDLAVQWWNWLYNISGTANPGLEVNSGAFSYKGADSGVPGVFFLSGVFSGLTGGVTTVNRTVTIQDDQSLFFPLINQSVDNTVPLTDPLTPPSTFTVDEMLTSAFGIDILTSYSNPTSLFLTIDGNAISGLNAHRQTHDGAGFNLTITSVDNLLNFGGYDASFGTGIYPSTFASGSDGYWVAMAPLSQGEHTLNFGAAVDCVDPSGNFLFTAEQNITYNVTVTAAAPEPTTFVLIGVGLLSHIGFIARRKCAGMRGQ